MRFSRYPSDPVLLASDFRCAYCGRDLLADLDTFLTIVRDHLVPRSAGGPDHHANRVASCAACDRLKGDALTQDLAHARELVAVERQRREKWFALVRSAAR